MNNLEFVKRLYKIATQYKTIYMWGCFGQLITGGLINYKKSQYKSWYSRSKEKLFRSMIGKDYYAFDCVNLIKGVLWGWDDGDVKYRANEVPDVNANTFIKLCKEISTDFTSIRVGEVVWLNGHIGVYIGHGNVIEATPKWKNGVQITKLTDRKWLKHGFIPWIHYVEEKEELSIEECRKLIQEKCEFSEPEEVWKLLDLHEYSTALYNKFANAMR